LGPARLKSQFAAAEEKASLISAHAFIDPRPPDQETPIMNVKVLRTAVPLYFEAEISVRGSRKHWGDLDREKDIVRDDWGHDDTATFLYTPWRVYELKVSKHTEFYTRGVSLREKMARELELAAKAARQRESKMKTEPNQAPEPTPTTVTPPAGQEARQP
jgi:hypothetical protein